MAPLFHAAGSVSVLQTMYVGAKHVILPSFDPGEMLDVIEREGVTATLGVPTMVAAAVEEQLARPRDVSSLRFFSHGGSPIAMEVVRRGRTGVPDHPVRPPLRRDRDRAARHRPTPRGAVARHATREVGRPGRRRGRGRHPRSRWQSAPRRRARRGHDARQQHHGGLLEQARADGGRTCATGGTGRAMSGDSTPTATCSCSTGRRT